MADYIMIGYYQNMPTVDLCVNNGTPYGYADYAQYQKSRPWKGVSPVPTKIGFWGNGNCVVCQLASNSSDWYSAYSGISSLRTHSSPTNIYNNLLYGNRWSGYPESVLDNVVIYSTLEELLIAFDDNNWVQLGLEYPITYSSSNSTVSGPSEAAVGDTVIVSATPDVGYGITDASSQIIVTNNDIAVPYTWDAANNRITFTMPDPS